MGRALVVALSLLTAATVTAAAPSASTEGGFREALHWSASLVGEVTQGDGTAPTGAERYAGLVDLTLQLDTRALGLWPGGTLFATLENGHGDGLSIRPGGVDLPTSDIVAPPHTELADWGLDQELAQGRLLVRLGRQDANDLFAVNPAGADFLVPAFTLVPTVPMPTFPTPALGAAAVVSGRQVSVGAGVFDGSSALSAFGLEPLLEDRSSTFAVGEVAVHTRWGHRRDLGGSYRLGVWDRSGGTSAPRCAGAYVVAEQALWAAGGGGGAGLRVFTQAGWAQAGRSPVTRHVGAGLSWIGLLPGRPGDELGLGLQRTWLASRTGGGVPTAMDGVELFYRFAVTSWLSLQPDLQHYRGSRPSGGDSSLIALRWIVSLGS